MASKNHTHKYHYVNIGKRDKPRYVYACAAPDCSHFIPENSERLVVGKKSICWECLKEMIISKDIFRKRTRKPRCWECRGVTSPKLENAAEDTNKNIEKEKLSSALDMILNMRLK